MVTWPHGHEREKSLLAELFFALHSVFLWVEITSRRYMPTAGQSLGPFLWRRATTRSLSPLGRPGKSLLFTAGYRQHPMWPSALFLAGGLATFGCITGGRTRTRQMVGAPRPVSTCCLVNLGPSRNDD